MRHMVSIDDVVIPVSLTGLKSIALKPESAFPATGFGGRFVLRKRELTSIIIPATKYVNSLNTGGSTERER
jgi:hypothetical protein